MRLLNTSTLYLHNFHDDLIPPYVILSHTWGGDEVVFQDLEKPSSKLRAGYIKIISCCALARSEGWEYIWIDTCCIDKTSSAELSEAINSMYQWYKNAEVCYVYMADFTLGLPTSGCYKGFGESRWFTRGWTLQELLAPENVVFFDRNWEEIGTKLSLQIQVSNATCIPTRALADPTSASVAAKMSWAAGRKTTRVEDIAYCLMGLFDVNMPLLYGEGPKAFMRLQETILRNTTDESLFAWQDRDLCESGIFARSPDAFFKSGNVVPVVDPRLYRAPSIMTNRGLEMDIHFNVPVRDKGYLLHLTGAREMIGFEEYPLFIRLRRKTEESYVRMRYVPLFERSMGVYGGNYFDVALSPPNHGFSLVQVHTYDEPETVESMVSELRKAQQLLWHLREYKIEGNPPYIGPLFLFGNARDETFILEVRRSEKLARFKVFIPREPGNRERLKNGEAVDLPEMKAFFDTTAETDRKSSVSLQAGSVLSIESRKRSENGSILHMIEIKVLCHG
ncbi:MAG: hypothetical protein Q9225_002995 [Loekoesia sp. 1 TL-2023]